MIYQFGSFHLDSEMFELRKNNKPVAMEPQVFNLLLYLIHNRDRIASRDDLIAAVWQGRAVSDTTLSSGIFALRRAVGDSGETQNVIRTVQRRGFRFVAEIKCDSDATIRLSGEAFDGSSEPDPTVIEIPKSMTQPVAKKNTATVMPTLVVLPFKIASAGLDDYFCDGLTEDVIAI